MFYCVEKENGLTDLFMSLETAHVNVDVFREETETLKEALLMLQVVFDRNIRKICKEVEKCVTIKGLDKFGKSVL